MFTELIHRRIGSGRPACHFLCITFEEFSELHKEKNMAQNKQQLEKILAESPPDVSNFSKRIEFLAKALAAGASIDRWTPKFKIIINAKGEEKWLAFGIEKYSENLQEYLNTQWGFQQPQISFLHASGYVAPIKEFVMAQKGWPQYILTPKAISLLDVPLEQPNVFISYKRGEGTALALLVLARLQARGVENPFLDLRLRISEDWDEEIEKAIINANTFIGILTPKSLESDFIKKEIAVASCDSYKKFVWINHTDWKLTYPNKYLDEIHNDAPHMTFKDFIGKTHWAVITDDSAKQYNATMDEMLQDLGYAPKP